MRELIYNLLGKTVLRNGVTRTINSRTVVLPASVYKYYPDEYEVAKFKFLQRWIKPGSTVLDIGAHIGLFTIFLAQMTGNRGKVLSFEPSSQNFSILQETIRLNAMEGVCEAYQEAVAESAGRMKLYVTDNFASNANTLSAGGESAAGFETISAINLDAERFSQYQVSALKIDAEGAEIDIFKGGLHFFERNRPACTVEIHPMQIAANKQHVDELIAIADRLGYSFFSNDNPVDKSWIARQTACFEVQMVPSRVA